MTTSELQLLSRVRDLAATGIARTIRRSNRLSLAEIAAHTGTSKSTVYRWETGQRKPSGDPALRYGQLLDELMGRQ